MDVTTISVSKTTRAMLIDIKTRNAFKNMDVVINKLIDAYHGIESGQYEGYPKLEDDPDFIIKAEKEANQNDTENNQR